MSYHVTYKIETHNPPLKAEEVPKGHGACDALLITSILHEPSGASSTAFVGMDGRTQDDLTPDDLFKVWTLLAKNLAEMLPPGGRQELCDSVFESIRAAVLAGREDDHG